jgi:hypothetical protein
VASKLIARVTQVLRTGLQSSGTDDLPLPDFVEIRFEPGRHAGYLLVRLKEDGAFGGDTWHMDLDLALEQAAFEYGLRPQDFKIVKDDD